MPVPVIAIATALIPLVLPVIQQMLESGKRPDGTPLTEEEIAAGRQFVDDNHAIIQNLPEDGS